MKYVVDAILVERLLDNLPYEELVGYYEYTHEEIAEASYYIDHTAPDDLIELMEELAAQREEEEALWEVWEEHCF
jgi:hypothetical protein